MKSSGAGRVLATLFLGVTFGIYKHYTQMKVLQGGRDAYLASEGRWFDNVTLHHATGHMLIAGVILAAIAVGLYELIAAGFSKVAGPSTAEE